MSFDSKNAMDILDESLAIAAFVLTPCLASLSYVRWRKRLRQSLPRWRNALGLISIAITLLNWVTFMVLGISDRIGLRTNFISDDWALPVAFLVLAGTSFAFALRGAARIQAIVAGLLMIGAWATSVVS